MKRQENAAYRLLAKDAVINNQYLVYRLTPQLVLSVKHLLSKKALGAYCPDQASVCNAVAGLPFVRLIGNGEFIKLSYHNSFRRVVVTGMRPQVVLNFLDNYQYETLGYAKPIVEMDEMCISMVCGTKYEAKQLCMYLRELKSKNHRFHEKMSHGHCKIRIAIESSRIYSLFVENVQAKKMRKIRQMSQRKEGIMLQTIEQRYFLYFQMMGGISTFDEECEEKCSVGNRTQAQGSISEDEEDKEQQEAGYILSCSD